MRNERWFFIECDRYEHPSYDKPCPFDGAPCIVFVSEATEDIYDVDDDGEIRVHRKGAWLSVSHELAEVDPADRLAVEHPEGCEDRRVNAPTGQVQGQEIAR